MSSTVRGNSVIWANEPIGGPVRAFASPDDAKPDLESVMVSFRGNGTGTVSLSWDEVGDDPIFVATLHGGPPLVAEIPPSRGKAPSSGAALYVTTESDGATGVDLALDFTFSK